MYDLILKKARIADEGFDENLLWDICVNDGKISSIKASSNLEISAKKIVDINENFVCAGFIDIHFHGAANFDVCDESENAIFKVAKQKLKEGVTSIVPATLTLSKNALKNTLNNLKFYSQTSPYTRLLGVHLEGPFINPQMAGAQNTEFTRAFDISEIDELNSIFKILKLSFSPELDGSENFVKELLKRKIVPSAAHTNASFDKMKSLYLTGLKNITHFGNRTGEFTSREIGVIGAGLLFDDIVLEIIADKIHLSPDFINLTFSKKDLSKVILVTDSMRASGLSDGVYSLGGLDVKVSQGAARLCSNSALAGSVLKMNEALKNLCQILNLKMKNLSKCASLNAATSLNLSGYGEVKEGNYADFAVLDSNFNVLKTIVGGEIKFEI